MAHPPKIGERTPLTQQFPSEMLILQMETYIGKKETCIRTFSAALLSQQKLETHLIDINGDVMKLILVKRAVKYYAAVEKIEGSLYVQIRTDLWDVRKNIKLKARGRTVLCSMLSFARGNMCSCTGCVEGVQKRPCHPVTSYF